jgi:glycosyltransferase involved in cell wall biosynthesis
MSDGDRRIRVLAVIGSMQGGGAERQLLEILTRLDRTRFVPELYLSHRQGDLLEHLPPDIPVHSFWDGYAGTLRSKVDYLLGLTERSRLGHLSSTIRRRKIDLVYDHCYLATLDAAVASAQAGVARVSVSVVDPKTEVQFHARGDAAREMARASRAFGTADAVIAVSEGVKSGLVSDLSVPPERVEVIYNMVDLEASRRLSLVRTEMFAPGRFHVVTVGRLVHQKGNDVILLAIEILVRERGLDRLQWHFVGDGPLRAELELQAKSLGLADHVQFHGYRANPYSYYRAADLFVLASRYEGFGCVLIEAMACGVPVVATDCPSGPREILDDGRYGTLVPVDDPGALAEAVQQAAGSTVRNDPAREVIEGYLAQTFSYGTGVPRIESLFERVMANRAAMR